MYHPRLMGSHYEMGYHYGELLYKNGVFFDDIIRLSEEQSVFGRESLSICEQVIPNICEELRGLSDGLQIDYKLFSSWLLCIYCFGDEHGCSCFCVSSNDTILFGRNSDMFPEYKKTSESILCRPNDGNIFLGHSTAMVSIEDGINAYGLAAGMTFLLPKRIKAGLNAGFLIRAILENCKTIEEAIAFLEETPISSAQNIVIADRYGDMAVVECNCDAVYVRKNDKFVIATNHFVSEKMKTEQANPIENWYYSNDRYNTIANALGTAETIDQAYVKAILSGKHGFMCQYEKRLGFDTLWSVVYDLKQLTIECAEGNPGTVAFKEDTRLNWGIKKG